VTGYKKKSSCKYLSCSFDTAAHGLLVEFETTLVVLQRQYHIIIGAHWIRRPWLSLMCISHESQLNIYIIMSTQMKRI